MGLLWQAPVSRRRARRRGRSSRPGPIQVGLQDDRGGGAVDYPAAAASLGAGLPEDALGLDGRQSLVLKRYRYLEHRTQRLGELLHEASPIPRLAGEHQRMPDDHERYVVLLHQLRDRLDVFGSSRADRAERNGRAPVVVGDRDADPGVAEVQSEHSPAAGELIHVGHRLRSSSSLAATSFWTASFPASPLGPPAKPRIGFPPAPPPIALAAGSSSRGASTPRATRFLLHAATIRALPPCPVPSTTAAPPSPSRRPTAPWASSRSSSASPSSSEATSCTPATTLARPAT